MDDYITFVHRCKMLSHLAFVCVKEGRPCPLYAVGCTKVHSSAQADAAGHVKLLLDARLSGACCVSKHFEQLEVFYNFYTTSHYLIEAVLN